MSIEGWHDKRYVDAKKAERSYRPKAGSMSPGLRRARQPFLVKNAITGILLGGFVVGVYTYSISAVKQEEFDDVDDQARALSRARAAENAVVLSLEDEKKAMEAAAASLAASVRGRSQPLSPSSLSETPPPTAIPTPEEAGLQAGRRGVLAELVDKRFPSVLDPRGKTFVWGAPPVDNVGSSRQKK